MSESGGSESRRVTPEQLKSGVQLSAGRKFVLVVDRVKVGGSDEGGLPDAPYAIEVQLTAAGGTPLAAERVRIVDPDSGEQIGDPGRTDEHGILRARVPEQKEYHFFPLPDDAEDHPDPWSAFAPAPAGQEHSVLFVVLSDESGQPLKGEKVNVKDESGTAHELVTDDEGHIRLATDPGVYQLEVKGSTFVAHTLFTTDLGDDPQPYRFTLG